MGSIGEMWRKVSELVNRILLPNAQHPMTVACLDNAVGSGCGLVLVRAHMHGMFDLWVCAVHRRPGHTLTGHLLPSPRCHGSVLQQVQGLEGE